MRLPKNLNRRAHIILPADVVADIDKLVGERGRSAFLTELARREITLRRQREVLRETAGAWKAEDHPELAEGARGYAYGYEGSVARELHLAPSTAPPQATAPQP
jgi:hypothetical protein